MTLGRVLTAKERGEIKCPAGRPVETALEGAGCYCPIEEHLLTGVGELRSVIGYCAGNYQACPTWREDKENRWAMKLLDVMVKDDPEPTRQTLLDQDPERVPMFAVPPDD